MNNKRKYMLLLLPLLLLTNCERPLPKPEVIDGFWSTFGIDKNINTFPKSDRNKKSSLDKHLNRTDTVYFDMRMHEDPANYEVIGGDRFMSGFIQGFTSFGYPYVAPLGELPPEIGEGYSGPTLFSYDEEANEYIPNYVESTTIISDAFPREKNIFLMCGGGGYAQWMKEFLLRVGYDKDKVYNVGCYWHYEGPNNVQVKKTNADGEVSYDFELIPTYPINFEDYHAL